ncbi:hypothetical protein [Phenylobacterium sp.]|uniref:hypothetical protein n=1 Tax=Phenylobacterium sp. TaxID=1871053 RepID=UPI002FCAE07F
MSAALDLQRVIEVGAGLRDGVIETEMDRGEIVRRVMDRGQLVLLKHAFPDEMLTAARTAVAAWGREVPAAETDDFRGNYHRRRAMVARQQQAPHVFHDYNFNDLSAAPPELEATLRGLFEPLRLLYNDLTGNGVRFGIPEAGPYVHPQLIHYPSGGGFFARHWHNLTPQKLGFIVSLSKRGRDFRNGGTCFEIDGEVVDMEARQEIGDICIWRYDHQHWVTQSDLRDKFDWDSDAGRWVATFAYFDPRG